MYGCFPFPRLWSLGENGGAFWPWAFLGNRDWVGLMPGAELTYDAWVTVWTLAHPGKGLLHTSM